MFFITWKFTISLCSLVPLEIVYNQFLLNKQGGAEDQRNWASFKAQREFPSCKAAISEICFPNLLPFPLHQCRVLQQRKTWKEVQLLVLSQKELSWNWASPEAGECMRLQISIPSSSSWALLHPSPLRQRPLHSSVICRMLPCSSITHHCWFPILLVYVSNTTFHLWLFFFF